MKVRVLAATLALVASACMQAPAAHPVLQLDPIRVGPPGSGELGPVAFLTGCWRGPISEGRGVYEERFTAPAAGIVLGTSRMWDGTRLFSFEYLTIRSTEAGVVLVPAPGGSPSPARFALSESDPGRVTFADPEHDYPRRIHYALDADGALEVRIDGGADDPQPRRWTLARVSCDG